MGRIARLVVAASAVALAVLPPLAASAAITGVDAKSGTFSGSGPNHETTIYVGDTVSWHILDDGPHTVTPDDPKSFSASKDLKEGDDFDQTFNNAGSFPYYCAHHGSKGKGMWGTILVKDPAATTTTTTTTEPSPTTQPPTTATTAPAPAPTPPPPPTATTVPVRPNQAAPAPTTTTTKPAKKDKETTTTTVPETTTTTAPPPLAAPVETTVPPNSAPPDTTTTVAPVAPPAPEGNAVAIVEDGKPNRQGTKLLIASGAALGLLGIGTGVYKWRNRSSRYWPA